MGGELQVSSVLGQGSRFFFEVNMPVAQTKTASDATNTIAITPGLPGAKGTRVLIVDDNPMARDILQSLGESLGWRCDVVASGEDALEQLSETSAQPYEIVLLDSRMPGMDGWETARRIRQAKLPQPGLRVLMVSAQGREGFSARSPRETQLVDGYLIKPITSAMLMDAVMEANAGPASAPPATQTNHAQRLAGLRILVVEDNLLNQQIARGLLTRQGAVVQVAGGGLAGVQDAVQADPPFDAVLMDVQMPDIDGLEATRRIRAHDRLRSMPIIAMTANAMESDKLQCREAGMVDHVSKPVDLEQLIASLLRHTGHAASAPAAEPLPLVDSSIPVAGPVIDLGAAIARMGGNRELYNLVATAFCGDVKEQFSVLQEAVRTGQWVDAARYAHTLKGLAGTVGAVGLAQQAVDAEVHFKVAAQTGHMTAPTTNAVLSSLNQSLQQAWDALQEILPPPPPPALPQGSPGEQPQSQRLALIQALDGLIALLADNNMRSTVESAEIRGRFGDAVGEPLMQVDSLVQQLSFTPALAQCQSLRDSLDPSS
jgi:CheY-like chemotaxis protein